MFRQAAEQVEEKSLHPCSQWLVSFCLMSEILLLPEAVGQEQISIKAKIIFLAQVSAGAFCLLLLAILVRFDRCQLTGKKCKTLQYLQLPYIPHLQYLLIHRRLACLGRREEVTHSLSRQEAMVGNKKNKSQISSKLIPIFFPQMPICLDEEEESSLGLKVENCN